MSTMTTTRPPITFANITANEMFPTLLWIVDLAPDSMERVNTRISRELDHLTGPREPKSPGQTFQTDQHLHENQAFDDLRTTILKAAKGALEQLAVAHEGIEVTALWANFNPPGAKHSVHSHPNNYLSGVYYLQTTPGADAITFFDPRLQAEVIMPPILGMNRYNGNSFDVEAVPGRLVLFPAWLKHEVGINKSNRERISLSFNLMFPSFTERMSAPLWRGTV